MTRIKPPNYFDNPSGTYHKDWQTIIQYNTLGQIEEQESPDEGITKFIYDYAGNLRFSQNSLQATPKDLVNEAESLKAGFIA